MLFYSFCIFHGTRYTRMFPVISEISSSTPIFCDICDKVRCCSIFIHDVYVDLNVPSINATLVVYGILYGGIPFPLSMLLWSSMGFYMVVYRSLYQCYSGHLWDFIWWYTVPSINATLVIYGILYGGIPFPLSMLLWSSMGFYMVVYRSLYQCYSGRLWDFIWWYTHQQASDSS